MFSDAEDLPREIVGCDAWGLAYSDEDGWQIGGVGASFW